MREASRTGGQRRGMRGGERGEEGWGDWRTEEGGEGRGEGVREAGRTGGQRRGMRGGERG